MTNFAPIEPATATAPAAELFTQVNNTFGLVPNMTKVMANSPALLKAYLALAGAVSGGALPAGTRERLAIATAQLNGCEYCLSAHTYIGATIAKVETAELEAARTAHSDDPHIEALLQLSNEIAANNGDVSQADLQAARRHGVTDEEIGEVVANLALNILTNYFNLVAEVDNDWPVVSVSSVAAGI